jgi:hypothetical protein
MSAGIFRRGACNYHQRDQVILAGVRKTRACGVFPMNQHVVPHFPIGLCDRRTKITFKCFGNGRRLIATHAPHVVIRESTAHDQDTLVAKRNQRLPDTNMFFGVVSRFQR